MNLFYLQGGYTQRIAKFYPVAESEEGCLEKVLCLPEFFV